MTKKRNKMISAAASAAIVASAILPVVPGMEKAEASTPNPISDFEFVPMEGYVTITAYNGTSRDVIIPETINGLPVRIIGVSAFENKRLDSLVIPNTVTEIGEDAFSGNYIKVINIPDSVTKIGKYGFGFSHSARELNFGNSGNLKEIGDFAFSNLSPDVKKIVVPHGVTTLGNYAFYRSEHLTTSKPSGRTLVLPNTLTQVGVGINLYSYNAQKKPYINQWYSDVATLVYTGNLPLTMSAEVSESYSKYTLNMPRETTNFRAPANSFVKEGIIQAPPGTNLYTPSFTTPLITVSENQNSELKETHSVTVSVNDEYANSSYQWTISPNFPTEGDWTPFNSSYAGTMITTPEGYSGQYYLHVKSINADGLVGKYSSGSFNVGEVPFTAPTLTASTTAPTNQNVTVTINYPFSATVKEYRVNGGTWQTYTSPVAVNSNGTIEARAKNASGKVSDIGALNVSNIDKTAPSIPTVAYDIMKNEVTITGGSDSTSGVKEVRYQLNNGSWTVYTDKLVLADGTYTVRAKTIDLAGNESTVATEIITITEQAYQKAFQAVEKARSSFASGNLSQAQLDKNSAQPLVNQLGDDPRKADLQGHLDTVQRNIDKALAEQEQNAKYAEALAAVEKAENLFTSGNLAQAQSDKHTAQTLVNQMGDDSRKEDLQSRLNALQTKIDKALAEQEQNAKYAEALAAVEKAEGSFNRGDLTQAQSDKNTAQSLVNQMGTDSRKATLQGRLDALQTSIDNALAEPENTAPTNNGQIPTQTVRVDASPIQLDVAAYFKDAENDVLSYELKSVSNANASATIEGSVIEITPNRVGPTNIMVKVTDPSGLSVEQTFTVNVTQAVLTVPTNVVAVADSPTEVTVSFEEVDGATEYIIKRNGSIIGQTNNGLFFDKDARHSQTYTYEVIAKNQFTQSAPASVTVTTPPQYRSVTFEWAETPGAIRYDIYRDGQKIGDTTGLTFTDAQAIEGKNYRYKIVVITPNGEGLSEDIEVIVPEEDISKEIDLAEPTTPMVQNVQAVLQNNIAQVTWEAFENATRYRVQTYVYNEESGEFEKQGFARTVTGTSIGLNTLQEGNTYQFEVIPMTNKTLPESAGRSNEVEFAVTPPPVVETPTEAPNERYNFNVQIEGTTATLTWDAMEDVSRYRVQLYMKDSSGEFKKEGAARAIAETTFTYEKLAENAEYEFVVEPRIGYKYDLTQAFRATATIGAVNPPEEEETTEENRISNIKADMQGTTATISWDSLSINEKDITSYRIVRYVKDDVTGQYKADGLTRTVAGTSYKDTYKLKSGNTYKYEIIPRVGSKYDDMYSSTISDVVNP